jgi:hypothetical protein
MHIDVPIFTHYFSDAYPLLRSFTYYVAELYVFATYHNYLIQSYAGWKIATHGLS